MIAATISPIGLAYIAILFAHTATVKAPHAVANVPNTITIASILSNIQENTGCNFSSAVVTIGSSFSPIFIIDAFILF